MERDSHRARVSENARGRQMDLRWEQGVLEGKEEDTLKTRARVMKNNCQSTETYGSTGRMSGNHQEGDEGIMIIFKRTISVDLGGGRREVL